MKKQKKELKRYLQLAVIILTVTLSSFGADQKAQAADIDITVTKLYQNDYPQKLDNSNETIAESGCTLTAHTMGINHALEAQGLHKKNPDGSQGPILSYTPDELNTLLNNYRYQQKIYKKDAQGNYVKDESGHYVVERVKTKNGWSVTIGDDGKPIGSDTTLNMGALLKAVKADTKNRSFEGVELQGKKYHAPGWCGIPDNIGSGGVILDENYKYILDELEAGRPVVVRTFDDKHSVLVKSFKQAEGQPEGKGRYDIADPWKKADGTSREWLDDKDYKNKIWNWGLIVFQKGGLHDPYEVPSDYWIDTEYLYDPNMNPDQYGPQIFVLSFSYSLTVITLISFTATEQDGKVLLEWETASEIDNTGFHIWRSETEDGEYIKITDHLIPAEGGATFGVSYSYEDSEVLSGQTYYYKLEDIDNNGVSTFHKPTNGIQAVFVGPDGGTNGGSDGACFIDIAAHGYSFNLHVNILMVFLPLLTGIWVAIRRRAKIRKRILK
ncbi:MAG: hypothetical protein HF978_18175 [Desulfobacteraceae bacterium]|nr:hypothetical protein [Desulfobacteraceae bacterium]MBC2757476.1 hypothetical protein [Desulfobacteraceae bacterium]